MGTLATELAPHAEQLSPRPRIYADANVPAGLVGYMRQHLQWDVLFVLEEDELRRAPDTKHYRLAQQLRRTLVTMDRDYLDDRRFPPAETSGVLVIQAPDEPFASGVAMMFSPPGQVQMDRSTALLADRREPLARGRWTLLSLDPGTGFRGAVAVEGAEPRLRRFGLA